MGHAGVGAGARSGVVDYEHSFLLEAGRERPAPGPAFVGDQREWPGHVSGLDHVHGGVDNHGHRGGPIATATSHRPTRSSVLAVGRGRFGEPGGVGTGAAQRSSRRESFESHTRPHAAATPMIGIDPRGGQRAARQPAASWACHGLPYRLFQGVPVVAVVFVRANRHWVTKLCILGRKLSRAAGKRQRIPIVLVLGRKKSDVAFCFKRSAK